jgi:phytoene desaturase
MDKSDFRGPRAAVIGSGFGGIAAAIRLQAAGVATTIFEKRDQPGGRAYVYKQDGFTFDAGPTVITAPEALHELFEVAGRRLSDYVELMPVSPFYRLQWEDGTSFDYTNDEAQLFRQIEALCPADVEGYQKFYEYSKDVFREGYEKLVHVPFQSFWDMIRVSPQLLRLKAYRSVYNTVAGYVEDPHLRQAFSFHSLLIGGNPFTSSSIYTLIHYLERKWGVFFPRGGTGALIQGLLKLFEDIGGQIKLSSPVDEIVVSRGQIKGVIANGRTHSFDLVVSNADVVHTYQHLLRQQSAVRGTARRLARAPHSMSLFLIYFGTKKRYPNIAHHTVIFGPRYRELLADIFNHGVLADDFSLYLHAPTVSDPTLAPEGCEGFYVLSPVPHLGKGSIDWATAAEPYADRILNYLDARYLPGLKENLVTKRIFTPLDFQSELNAHQGSAFSLEPTLRQSAYFRVHNREDRIDGLYFVGAGTHPGAGVPGVINSAKATVSVILPALGKQERVLGSLEPMHV